MVNVKKRPKRNYKKRVVRRSVKPSKTFAKKVQAIIRKNVETKQAFRSENNSPINPNITTIGDIFQLLPNVLQGTTDQARIGDQIRGQSITVKGFALANLTYTGISSCRLGVRIMIVQPKQYGSFAQIQGNATAWLQLLLKRGGTTSAFTGIVQDLFSNINTDAITCYYNKVMYINAPYLQTAVGDTSVFNTTKFFSKTLKLKNKLLKYDGSIDSGLTPSQYNPVLLIGYVKLDGTAPDANNQISLSYDTYFNYEDA